VLPARKTLISRFLPQLERLSQRTNVPITSLAFSFALLHELTALLPLVILFFVFQTIGAGSAIVQWVGGVSEDREAQVQGFDWRGRVGSWLEEGERRAEKVGRRYGIFGFEKGSQVEQNKSDVVQERKGMRAAGSVTNAVAAYVVVKVRGMDERVSQELTRRQALLPARIGLSLWAAPGFARFAVEPIRRTAFRWKIAAGTSSTKPR
jgi:hypothetical protein